MEKDENIKQLRIDDSIYALTYVSMIKAFQSSYRPYMVTDYFIKSVIIFFVQAYLLAVLCYAALFKKDSGDDVVKPSVESMVLRLLAAYMFHMQNFVDLADAQQRIKFLVQNPDRFEW